MAEVCGAISARMMTFSGHRPRRYQDTIEDAIDGCSKQRSMLDKVEKRAVN